MDIYLPDDFYRLREQTPDWQNAPFCPAIAKPLSRAPVTLIQHMVNSIKNRCLMLL